MNSFLKLSFTLFLGFISLLTLNAQPPGGRGPRPGGGPEEMLKREKQALYEKTEDLTEDQKLLIDGIYSEFAVTLKETFRSARESGGDRETIREKMKGLREEKDLLIADVLNEKQYEIYKSISSRQRRRGNNPPEKKPSN